MIELFALATVTALATGLGALPVYWLGSRVRALQPALWGVVIGVMTVASVQGLILPGLDEGDDGALWAGLAAGVVFLLVARRIVASRGVLVIVVLFVHSLPEGLALGAAWASATVGLGVFVFLAIAIQNVPEGTAAAIGMRDDGAGLWRAFWAACLTSAPQPPGAVAAYGLVEATRSLLAPSFGFAAGAMLALVVVELVPEARRAHTAQAATAAVVSAALMVLLGTALEVG